MAQGFIPSNTLRKWFPAPGKWPVFRKKYRKKLKDKKEIVERLRKEAKRGRVPILYSARDMEHNNAVVLKGKIT